MTPPSTIHPQFILFFSFLISRFLVFFSFSHFLISFWIACTGFTPNLFYFLKSSRFPFYILYFELRMRAPPNPSNEGHSGLKGIPSKDKDNVVGCKYIVYFICGFWPTIFGTSWILLDLLLRSQVLIQCMLYLPGAKTTTTIGRDYVCTRYSHGEMRWRGKKLCPTATREERPLRAP